MADYTTLAEVKAQAGRTTAVDNASITALIVSASRLIDGHYHQPEDYFVVPVAATSRIFAGSGGAVQPIDDCIAVTLVGVKDSPSDVSYTAWAASDWLAGTGDWEDPNFNKTPYRWIACAPGGSYSIFNSGSYRGLAGFTPDADALVGGQRVPTVQVTARWGGYATAPYTVQQACIMQVIRWLKRVQGGMSDALVTPEFGQLIFHAKLDPDVETLLRSGRYYRVSM